MADLRKAKIKILDGSNAGQEVGVLFNPAEYNLETSNKFQESAPPGLSSPIFQFVSGEAPTLSMDLYFDTYTDGEGKDVSEITARFAALLEIDADLHAPPRVEFKWGVFAFKAVIDKLSQRFTMFLADGTPVRATLNVSFRQYRTLAEQLADPSRQSADKTKRRVITAAGSIWHLAAAEYGQPRYWRVIARANRIDDPRALPGGTALIVPPLDGKPA